MKNTISAAILAGGESKRFGGSTKSNFIIGGKTILERIVLTLSELFDDIIIVTNKPSEFSSLSNCRFTEDHFKKAGPLGGIHAALISSAEPSVFIVAGDMPFLDRDIILREIEAFGKSSCDVLIPLIGNYSEPLHGIYRKSLLPEIEAFLSTDGRHAVIDFLSGVNVENYFIPDSDAARKAFTNINSLSDFGDMCFKP